jgi:hypothetical protein
LDNIITGEQGKILATYFIDLEKIFHYLAFRQAWKLAVGGWRSGPSTGSGLEVGGNGKIANLGLWNWGIKELRD